MASTKILLASSHRTCLLSVNNVVSMAIYTLLVKLLAASCKVLSLVHRFSYYKKMTCQLS